ncbi:MAG: nucleoside-diphosphate kinase [Methanophagales archaeon]|nr:nucleoside-diphosphate kinase [Methanophagales archaeon]
MTEATKGHQYTLIILKPDALVKSLTGNILTRLSEARLRIIGAKVVKVSRELAEQHYEHLKDEPFFNDLYEYFSGKTYGPEYERVLAFVYKGEDAISKVRRIAGATNPLEADPISIRGAYGRINKKGIMENVIHCSDSEESAKKEIYLWFDPDEIIEEIYPTKKVIRNRCEVTEWA